MSSKNMDLSSLIDKYKGDPVQFIEEVGGIKLTNFQKDYIRFFYENKEKRVYMMRSTRHANMNSWLYPMFLIMEKYEIKKRWVLQRPPIFLMEEEIKWQEK